MREEWQPPKHIKPWMVCAACRHRGYIITGARHFDTVMRKQVDNYNGLTSYSNWEQGFIDQWGRFYNRVDAMKAVKESGQPFNAERNGGNGEELYSEGFINNGEVRVMKYFKMVIRFWLVVAISPFLIFVFTFVAVGETAVIFCAWLGDTQITLKYRETRAGFVGTYKWVRGS